ncbi:hypothetical protein PoB_000639700 [Plakobranchus ocellatus]|uniref:Uncharacterized protein n=1 Tax=Plakobranchus ocellatus TaxID=259542 RepID=A0AAV3YAP6_9GAST|nr:hypothetical protein PoB_000639700 [Plakobranchus ocellatus]
MQDKFKIEIESNDENLSRSFDVQRKAVNRHLQGITFTTAPGTHQVVKQVQPLRHLRSSRYVPCRTRHVHHKLPGPRQAPDKPSTVSIGSE